MENSPCSLLDVGGMVLYSHVFMCFILFGCLLCHDTCLGITELWQQAYKLGSRRLLCHILIFSAVVWDFATPALDFIFGRCTADPGGVLRRHWQVSIACAGTNSQELPSERGVSSFPQPWTNHCCISVFSEGGGVGFLLASFC